MSATDKQEYILLDTDLSTRLAIMPAVSGHLYLELNEPGSGEIKIPLNSNTAALVESGQFAQVNYRGAARGGFFVENLKKDFADSGENGGKILSVSGRGALALLEDAIVWNDGTTNSSRTYTAKTKAAIFIELLDEAIARGTMAPLSYTFSATLDSNGAAWTDSETININVGMSLLDVARNFIRDGMDLWLDASTFELNAYKAGMGTDKSETIYFRVGTNCEEVSLDERGADIKNVLHVAYNGGFLNVTDPTSISNNRRREDLLDIKNAQTASSAVTYASAKIAQSKDPKKSISVKIYDGVGPRVFLDYDLGDYIMLDVEGVETKYRIYGIQLNWEGDGFADIVVDLNSIFYDHELQMSRDLNWLLNQWETAKDAKQLAMDYWAAIGGPNDVITSIAAMHQIGNNIYMGGSGMDIIGNINITSGTIASYNIASGRWSELAGGPFATYVYCMASYGTDLFVGGLAGEGIAKYDTLTNTWASMGGGLYTTDPFVLEQCRAMVVVGTKLYVTGQFEKAGGIGGTAALNVAVWDLVGNTWAAVGGGISNGLRGYALAAIGSTVYLGGQFSEVGGAVAALNVASWNGSTWAALDTGLDDVVLALEANGANILAGGEFTDYLSEWDGAAWTTYGGGIVNGIVRDITTFASDVYIVGDFTQPGNRLARYSGGSWNTFGSGLNGVTRTILLIDENIYLGGDFTTAGDKPSLCVAAYFVSFQALMEYLENSSASGFDMGAAIHNALASAITDYDEVPFWEDVSNALRKITWGNIKATLKTYFDALYVSLTSVNWIDLTDGGATTLHTHAGGGGTPGGSDTEVQYNDGGAFGGAVGLYYDDTYGMINLGRAGGVPAGFEATQRLFNLLAKADDDFLYQSLITWGDSAGTKSFINGYRAGGTKATPTALGSGKDILSVGGGAHDGTNWTTILARTLYRTTEAQTTSAHGAEVVWEGVPRTTTTREQFGELDELGFNIPTGRTYRVNGVQHTQNASTIIIPTGIGTSTYDDLQDYLNLAQASGRLTGGVLTAHAGPDGTLDISEMEGMIHTANTLGSPLIYFKKAAVASISLTDNAVNFIWITYTAPGGVPTLTYSANAARPTDDYNVFVVGRAWRSGNTVEPITTGQNIYNMWGRQHDRLMTKYGNMDRASGAVISAHATPLRLQADAGVWFFANARIDTAAVDKFHVWYKTGGGAWTESAELTLFSDVFDGGTSKVYENYQNGTSLGALGANAYGVYWIFICPRGEMYAVLGTSSYSNIGNAQAATIPASLPPYCVNWARLVGRVIIKKTAAAFYSVESVWTTTFTLSTVVDHASTSNLDYASSGHTGFEASGIKYPFEARLTLETGVPLSVTAQTAKTVLYLTKYNGERLAFYSGTAWSTIALGSDVSIKATDAQSGQTQSGTKVINGLTDTSQLVVGMEITGTGVGVGSVIATIDNPNQITGTVNSTATLSPTTVTFKLPASTVYDVFAYDNSGTAKLEFVAGQTTRTTQNGVDVKTAATTRRLVGSILTTATAGQMEISPSFMGVSNRYNLLAGNVLKCPGYNNDAASTTYAANSATFVEANSDGRINLVLCKDAAIEIKGVACGNPGSGGYIQFGIGIDTVTAPTVEAISAPGPAFCSILCDQTNLGLPLAKGSHYYSLLLCYLTGYTGGPTIYADLGGLKAGSSGADPIGTYIAGQILF
jgi:hypothetical protein